MFRYVLKLKKIIFVELLISLIVVSCTTLIPLFEMNLIDSLQNGMFDVSFAIRLVIQFIIVILVYCFTNYFSLVCDFKISATFDKNVSIDFFHSLLNMKEKKFKKYSVGEYLSIFSNEIPQLSSDYLVPIIDNISSLLSILISCIVIFGFVDVKIGIILIITSLIAYLLSRFNNEKMSEKRKAYLDRLGSYVENLKAYLTGQYLFRKQSVENAGKLHSKQQDDISKKRMSYGRSKAFTLTYNGFLSYLMLIVVFISVVILFLMDEISIGVAVAAFGYVDAFFYPISGIINNLATIQSTKSIQTKLLGILEDNEEKEMLLKPINKITCKDLSYSMGDKVIVNNVNLEFVRGSKIAIVGANGSGKSTLLNLIARLIEPNQGEILFDSVMIDELSQVPDIAYIRQHDIILPVSFEDNVTMFGEYELKKLDCYGFKSYSVYQKIAKCDNCMNLSGGEKQFVSLCRAICSGAKILLMDESFSAVDADTSANILKTLVEDETLTLLYITHNQKELCLFKEVLDMGKINGRIS